MEWDIRVVGDDCFNITPIGKYVGDIAYRVTLDACKLRYESALKLAERGGNKYVVNGFGSVDYYLDWAGIYEHVWLVYGKRNERQNA